MGADVTRASLNLFHRPNVTIAGRRAKVTGGSLRLLAYIALSGRRVDRRAASGILWPDGSDARAAGNLRSALWRLRQEDADLVEKDQRTLRLHPDTAVDLRTVTAWADRVVTGRLTEGDLDTPSWRMNALDLLPGWYDDWVVVERERLRQRLLHALEALSTLLVGAGRYLEAVDVAQEVVGREPLRESGQRVLVQAHLAEGNVGEAARCFVHFRTLLARELGVDPGPELLRIFRERRRPPVTRPADLAASTSPAPSGAG
jgi:DNA-binding SARP family transcriptional activator